MRKLIVGSIILLAAIGLSACQPKSPVGPQTGALPTRIITPDLSTATPTLTPQIIPQTITGKLVAGQKFTFQWETGSCGSANDQLNKPRGIAVDKDGNTYVADTGNNRVVKLDPQGKPVENWGKDGINHRPIKEPSDIALAPDGTFYMLNTDPPEIEHFSADGGFLNAVGQSLSTYNPRGIAVDSSGSIWIADTGDLSVIKADKDGKLITTIGGTSQTKVGQGQPTDVSIDARGNIWIAESVSGLIWALAPDQSTVLKTITITKSNSTDGPHLASAGDDVTWATDSEGFQVLALASDGSVVTKIDDHGDGPHQYKRPVGIAVDPTGAVYISDSDGCKVMKFSR